MVLLSLGVAGYAIGVYGLLPFAVAVHPDMRAGFEAQRAAVYTHAFAAAVALALGPFQFSARIRSRHLSLHRWLGRLYLGVGVLVGGISGLYMAAHAFGGPAARLGFGCLALAWLYTGARAYLAIPRSSGNRIRARGRLSAAGSRAGVRSSPSTRSSRRRTRSTATR
jgi:uncharacterized membrane protein